MNKILRHDLKKEFLNDQMLRTAPVDCSSYLTFASFDDYYGEHLGECSTTMKMNFSFCFEI